MLQVRNVSKWFGDVNVLNQISFNLNRGQRAGLVGPNGSGKSTLLRIIAGEMQPDQGRVQLAPASLRLGYLPQALELPPDATVADVLTAAQGERVSLETRLEQLAERIAVASNDELQEALDAYDRTLAEFDALGGSSLHADADVVLAGLDLNDVDQSRPVSALSGGQKTRLGLARLLLAQPDLLVLDEPTNHL
ncbi:MAG: ABC-F family ATP-binding cassette domain-containing protein, partial [Anaerolineae bacterium]|nr:ABC-F family ATP-binding cassette domain-containing protein [Anaerolineae bacterium]